MLYIIILLKYLDKKYHESCSLSEISSIKPPYLILILNSLEHIYYFLFPSNKRFNNSCFKSLLSPFLLLLYPNKPIAPCI
jgi:hypothetical protein